MSEPLIYAMSTKGELKIEEFNEIFKMVYLPGPELDEEGIDIDIRRQLIRLLDSLGYCEFDFNNRMVYMCPPCFALLPVYGLPKAVLTGARTPGLLAKIKIAVKSRKERAAYILAVQRNKNINIPPSLIIEAVDTLTIQEIAGESGVACRLERPVAWDLVNFSFSQDEIRKSLKFEKMDEPNWNRRVFIPSKLVFSRTDETIAGYKLVEYKNPVNQQPYHWLWDGENEAEVERDWGRYLALSSARMNILLYDGNHHKLAAPVTVPLPCLLARALTMCTGMAPLLAKTEGRIGSIPVGHPVHIYSGVPPVISVLIAEKLGQKIVPANLENEKGGVIYG